MSVLLMDGKICGFSPKGKKQLLITEVSWAFRAYKLIIA